jgi:hypothetical protein
LQIAETLVPKAAAPPAQSPALPTGVAVPAPFDPALTALIERAKADLAQRRAIAIDAIAVVEVRSVTWPNPGLGCPQPGMAYKQVPVDGLLIRLENSGQVFNYHGGGSKAPFLCEQPVSGNQRKPSPGAESR